MKKQNPQQAERGKNQHRDKTQNPGRSPYIRSRVTAGRDLLPSIDGRTTLARAMRDTYNAMISHAGGDAYISATQKLLARRIAATEAELINLEDLFARTRADGEQPDISDLDVYGRLMGQQRRCLEALGWRPHMRDVTPDPLTYAREYGRRKAEPAEEVST